MVVEQIDIEGIASLEAEDDAPVTGDLDGPEALQFAFSIVDIANLCRQTIRYGQEVRSVPVGNVTDAHVGIIQDSSHG